MRQICLDTETTGINADQGDRIVEVGCVEIVGRALTGDPETLFHVYTNPERDVPEEVVKVHGLTNEFLADKPLFADIAKDFVEFVRGAELIIHNARFDVGFLNMELKRLGLGKLEDYCPKITDSLELAKKKFPGQKNNLNALCSRYDISTAKRPQHGALLDARLLAEVYLALTREQGSLLGDQYESATNHAEPLPDASLLVRACSNPEDDAAHEEFIALINKKCKAGAIWTRSEAPAAE